MTVDNCFDLAFVLVIIATFFLGIKVTRDNLRKLDELLEEKEKKARETNAHS